MIYLFRMETKFCKKCRQEFWEEDSTGSDFDLCQDCWEADCDKSWWQMVEALDDAGLNV